MSPKRRQPAPDLRVLAFAALAIFAFASPSSAETRRIEAVGAVGVRAGDRSDPRPEAVDHAIGEAVLRVATEYLSDADIPEGAEDPDNPNSKSSATEGAALVKVLGKDMGRYASQFKVIEDRGLGPALFIEDPSVREEYVVVAEVLVDADLVRDRLVSAGLLQARSAGARAPMVRLVVQGVSVYPALVDIRELITGPVGAESATPIEFERGRATLAVETRLSASQLISAIEREAPPHLTIIRLGGGVGEEPRIAVRWTQRTADGSLPPVGAGRADWWRPGWSNRFRR